MLQATVKGALVMELSNIRYFELPRSSSTRSSNVTERHSLPDRRKHIAQSVKIIVKDFELFAGKISYISLDNASDNESPISYMPHSLFMSSKYVLAILPNRRPFLQLQPQEQHVQIPCLSAPLLGAHGSVCRQ
jgi:hypothetical protein